MLTTSKARASPGEETKTGIVLRKYEEPTHDGPPPFYPATASDWIGRKEEAGQKHIYLEPESEKPLSL